MFALLDLNIPKVYTSDGTLCDDQSHNNYSSYLKLILSPSHRSRRSVSSCSGYALTTSMQLDGLAADSGRSSGRYDLNQPFGTATRLIIRSAG
jgi:hypothetical protein